jgi:hypothetical protein
MDDTILSDTELRKYPTRFYGRTFRLWAGILYFGTPAILFYAIGFLNILKSIPNGELDLDKIVGPLIAGTLIAIPAVIGVFEVIAAQYAIISIHKEGLFFRYGTSYRFSRFFVFSNIFFVFIPILLITLWKTITLQFFPKRTSYLRWQHTKSVLLEGGVLLIVGRFTTISNDFEQDVPSEHTTFHYSTHYFGEPISKVIEAVQFYYRNPDARETLPSWQDEFYFATDDTDKHG